MRGGEETKTENTIVEFPRPARSRVRASRCDYFLWRTSIFLTNLQKIPNLNNLVKHRASIGNELKHHII